jgi:hypothetical protein
LNLPYGGASTSGQVRSTTSVSPATTTVYVSLQDSPGHGNPTFSFTLQVNSTNCTVANGYQSCAFTIQLPIGTDSLSILTTNANGVPLDYGTDLTLTVTAAGPNQLFPGEGNLSPIIAKATAQYAFQNIGIDSQGNTVTVPAISTQPFDAAGDAVSFGTVTTQPYGITLSSVTATQSVGQFTFVTVNVRHASMINSTSAPENSVTYGASGLAQYLVEVGNGTTNAFTTTVTLSTPEVQYTNLEFPQLRSPTLTVPPSSSALSLTCQFSSPTPTTDPCPGTASANIGIY